MKLLVRFKGESKMEIEFKQEECKNKEKMYQVGNVIEDDGSVFLV